MPEISAKTESEEQGKDLRAGPRGGEKQAPKKEVRGGSWGVNFANGLLENSDLTQPKKFIEFLVSLASQAAFVILLILLPLCYTQALNLPEFERTLLIMPPPPPPPPPAAPVRVIVKPKASLFENGRLIAPKAIPKHVEIVKEAREEPPGPAGIAGGVPGGVPGGALGGVLGGVIGNGMVPPPPSPPKAAASNRVLRVGGKVQAPRLIQELQPTYPALAKETRTQGVVVLDCVIDERGNVTQMKLVSGHPLLVQAALDAVRQWKYQPTLLNGQPVAVEMHVNVIFSMGS
jgi:protein TonB